MTAADLSALSARQQLPACPAGGVYTLNPVGVPPICNIPGHAMPKMSQEAFLLSFRPIRAYSLHYP